MWPIDVHTENVIASLTPPHAPPPTTSSLPWAGLVVTVTELQLAYSILDCRIMYAC